MEEAWTSIWLLIRSWITPAVLFLLLNVIIGTIAVTSKSLLAHRRHDDAAAGDGHVIVRTASHAFHRLRSLSLTRRGYGDFIFNPAVASAKHPKSDEISDASPETEVVKKEGENQPPTEEGESPAREPSARRAFEKKRTIRKEKVVEVEEEEGGGVDARADDFINRFRRQLHLQRLNSLLKYRENREK